MTALVAVDVGNSAIKAGRFDGDRIVERFCATHRQAPEQGAQDAIAALAEWVAAVAPAAVVAVAGVRPASVAGLRAMLRARGCVVRVAPEDFVPAIENVCVPPDSVGVDRLFGAAAAARGGCPAVVVDAGTAITVNAICARGTFRGGAIAPGVSTSFAALHRETAALPLVGRAGLERIERGGAVPPIGTDTRAALEAGVVRGLAGLVERLVRDVQSALAPAGTCRVVLTGGDAPLLAAFLSLEVERAPDLTLHGIAISARRSGP